MVDGMLDAVGEFGEREEEIDDLLYRAGYGASYRFYFKNRKDIINAVRRGRG